MHKRTHQSDAVTTMSHSLQADSTNMNFFFLFFQKYDLDQWQPFLCKMTKFKNYSKLKEFTAENIVEKKEKIPVTGHFLLFPTIFLKVFLFQVIKTPFFFFFLVKSYKKKKKNKTLASFSIIKSEW